MWCWTLRQNLLPEYRISREISAIEPLVLQRNYDSVTAPGLHLGSMDDEDLTLTRQVERRIAMFFVTICLVSSVCRCESATYHHDEHLAFN